MRHTFVLSFALLLGCGQSHGISPECETLGCGADETCCLGCSGSLMCVASTAECGCDDAGVDGSAGECGGPSRIACETGEYCDAPSCDAWGTCEPSAPGCERIYDPVCGCDGETYGNACNAQANGATVNHAGECSACGTRGAPSCPSGTFCRFGPSCGADDAGGSCVPLTSECDLIFAPVCGCDGATYGNRCSAEMVGVSIAAEGECASGGCAAEPVTITSEACDEAGVHWDGNDCRAWSGCCEGSGCSTGYVSIDACREAHRACERFCGGWVGPTCLGDEFCDFASDGCDWADASGVCRPRPMGCFEPGGVPICGCNGVTYVGECAAHMDGTDRAELGECPLPPG